MEKTFGTEHWKTSYKSKYTTSQFAPLPWKDSQPPTVNTLPNTHSNQETKGIFSGEREWEDFGHQMRWKGRGEMGCQS